MDWSICTTVILKQGIHKYTIPRNYEKWEHTSTQNKKRYSFFIIKIIQRKKKEEWLFLLKEMNIIEQNNKEKHAKKKTVSMLRRRQLAVSSKTLQNTQKCQSSLEQIAT